jgi:hypothetical protein
MANPTQPNPNQCNTEFLLPHRPVSQALAPARVAELVVFLSDVDEGGELVFPLALAGNPARLGLGLGAAEDDDVKQMAIGAFQVWQEILARVCVLEDWPSVLMTFPKTESTAFLYKENAHHPHQPGVRRDRSQ